MVGLLGITLTLGANLHGLNCLGARHIACFTIVYLICAKVQIIDNFPRILFFKMILTFMRCHLSNVIFYSKITVHVSYKLDALRLTLFQAYHVYSSLIARKMESLEISIML